MIGSWIWNAVSGVVGMLFAFVAAVMNNPLITSFERSIYGFAVAFSLMFVVRWFIGSFLGIIRMLDGGETFEFSNNSPSSPTDYTSSSAEHQQPADGMDALRALIRDNIIGDAPLPTQGQGQQQQTYNQPSTSRPKPSEPETTINFEQLLHDKQDSNEFSPMEPPKLATKTDFSAEDLASVIRTSFMDD